MATGVHCDTAVVLGSVMDELAVASLESTASMTAIVRRRVLQRLLSDERTTREALATDLAENDRIEVDVDRLEVQLHHDHLPSLEDEAFLEYDPGTGEVRRVMDPETIDEALDGNHES